MIDFKEIFPQADAAASPQEWLMSYLRSRSGLGGAESEFRCHPECTRPGCNLKTLPVPVSLLDLMGVALHRQEPLTAIYPRYYALGLMAPEGSDWIRSITLRLEKPCPFLENDLCGIYPVRPLACMLFPEYLVYENRVAAEAAKEFFRDFLCLRGKIPLSPERARIIRTLQELWDRETLVTNHYLFNVNRCSFNFANLIEELLRVSRAWPAVSVPDRPGSPETVANQVMEHYLHEHLAGHHPFDDLGARLYRLDDPAGQVQVLQLLQDDRLLGRLRGGGEDREVTFRLVRGKLKKRVGRRVPGEYGFY